MGTKYGVPYLRQVAIAKLVQMFPYTWTDYISSEAGNHVADFKSDMAVAAVVLAREHSVPIISPCCLWKHATPASGHNLKSYLEQTCKLEDGRTYTADAATISQCLRTGWALADFRQARLLEIFEAIEGCEEDRCQLSAATALKYIICCPSQLPLLSKTKEEYWQTNFGLCADCATTITSEWDDEMQALWDILPRFYELGSWDELLAASK
jgi:hypothetical protein